MGGCHEKRHERNDLTAPSGQFLHNVLHLRRCIAPSQPCHPHHPRSPYRPTIRPSPGRAIYYDATRALGYNLRFDFTLKDKKIMEAERINALSALLADLTTREAELRRYL
jgi:hypothetical protein